MQSIGSVTLESYSQRKSSLNQIGKATSWDIFKLIDQLLILDKNKSGVRIIKGLHLKQSRFGRPFLRSLFLYFRPRSNTIFVKLNGLVLLVRRFSSFNVVLKLSMFPLYVTECRERLVGWQRPQTPPGIMIRQTSNWRSDIHSHHTKVHTVLWQKSYQVMYTYSQGAYLLVLYVLHVSKNLYFWPKYFLKLKQRPSDPQS